jgi:hypothetical protein
MDYKFLDIEKKQCDKTKKAIYEISYEVTNYGFNTYISKRLIDYGSDISNCKLSYLHNLGPIYQLFGFDDVVMKTIIDYLLNYMKGFIITTTINERFAEFLEKTYPTYYNNKVPVGYSGGYQYHVCFKNIINKNYSCRYPEE